MSLQGTPAPKGKSRKRWPFGATDGGSPTTSTHDDSPTTPNPKRPRLDSAAQSSSMGVIDDHSVPTQADDHFSRPAPTTHNPPKKNRAKWPGIKSLLATLESSTNALPPLQSAIGSLNKFVHICEGSSKGRKDYDELRDKLDGLLEELAGHMSHPMGLVMTDGVKRLCAGIEAEIKDVEEKQARNTGRRLADAMEAPEEVMECYRRIHGHLERLTLNANLHILKMVDEQTA
ncbi:hypothetical protein FRC11_013541, partial [Ceratobasidium sp. 423]